MIDSNPAVGPVPVRWCRRCRWSQHQNARGPACSGPARPSSASAALWPRTSPRAVPGPDRGLGQAIQFPEIGGLQTVSPTARIEHAQALNHVVQRRLEADVLLVQGGQGPVKLLGTSVGWRDQPGGGQHPSRDRRPATSASRRPGVQHPVRPGRFGDLARQQGVGGHCGASTSSMSVAVLVVQHCPAGGTQWRDFAVRVEADKLGSRRQRRRRSPRPHPRSAGPAPGRRPHATDKTGTAPPAGRCPACRARSGQPLPRRRSGCRPRRASAGRSIRWEYRRHR